MVRFKKRLACQHQPPLKSYLQAKWVLIPVKYVNKDTNIAIVSVGRSSFPMVASALPFIDQMGRGAAQIRTLHSSASLNIHYFLLRNITRNISGIPRRLNNTIQAKIFNIDNYVFVFTICNCSL
ncbi:uncharacterized protein [Palaemon carinicauda]|uniref:uncharacterized protein n=1 Tax=Palaemon carinicauda TaxID=392227 RepID=UPI0035B65F58